MKSWREILKAVTERSNHNRETTFNSHLKIALSAVGSRLKLTRSSLRGVLT